MLVALVAMMVMLLLLQLEEYILIHIYGQMDKILTRQLVYHPEIFAGLFFVCGDPPLPPHPSPYRDPNKVDFDRKSKISMQYLKIFAPAARHTLGFSYRKTI